MRRAQAMLETVLAVLFISLVFLGLFQLLHMLTTKILMDHAAARAARARAVGFNDFMCRKSARVAMIPVAGRRLWPEEGSFSESSRIPGYLCTENEAVARGVLEYERWPWLELDIKSGFGLAPKVKVEAELQIPRFIGEGNSLDTAADESMIKIHGQSEMESHFPYYMNDMGFK